MTYWNPPGPQYPPFWGYMGPQQMPIAPPSNVSEIDRAIKGMKKMRRLMREEGDLLGKKPDDKKSKFTVRETFLLMCIASIFVGPMLIGTAFVLGKVYLAALQGMVPT